MPDTNGVLRSALVESYDYLINYLTKRLQSSELAHEALHDTYLRLKSGDEINAVQRPLGYLIKIAINLARDRQRAARRFATSAQVEALLDLADDAPDPAQTTEARSEFQAFEKLLDGLPPRRRAILLMSSTEELSPREIARRFGLSERMIYLEIKLARQHCAQALVKRSKK